MLGWFFLAIAFSATILNIKKKVSCFYLWTIANCYWIYCNIQTENYPQVGLFVLYIFVNIWGIIKWTSDEAE